MSEQAATVMADSNASGQLNIYAAVSSLGSVDAAGRPLRQPWRVSTARRHKNELGLI